MIFWTVTYDILHWQWNYETGSFTSVDSFDKSEGAATKNQYGTFVLNRNYTVDL